MPDNIRSKSVAEKRAKYKRFSLQKKLATMYLIWKRTLINTRNRGKTAIRLPPLGDGKTLRWQALAGALHSELTSGRAEPNPYPWVKWKT